MPDFYMDVDVAVDVFVNLLPLLDDTDFKTRETAVAYNAAGMDLVWNFQTTGGTVTQTAVTPTTAGLYDWTHVGDGLYKIEIPASGGGSINNDTEGFGWFTGLATGVLPWRGPVIGFRAAAINNALIDAPTVIDRLDAAITSRASQTSLDTLDDYVDTEIAAIKAKTDLIPAAPASTTNITAGTITTVTNLTNAATAGDLTATMKASVNAEADTAIADAALATAVALAAVAAFVDTEVAAILADTNDIQTRLPVALTGDGLMAADALRIAGALQNVPGTASAIPLTNPANQLNVNVSQISDSTPAAENVEAFFTAAGYAADNSSIGEVTGPVESVTGPVGSVTAQVAADVVKVSGDANSANNLKLFFNATGYYAGESGIGLVATVQSVLGLDSTVLDAIRDGLALEATLTAMKGLGWSIETLRAIYDAVGAGGSAPTAVEIRQEMDANSVDLNTLVTGLATTLAAIATRAAPGDAMDLVANAVDAAAVAPAAFEADAFTAPALAAMAAALLDLAAGVEAGMTLRQAQRLMLAASVGKLSGAGTTEVRIRDTNDTKDRVRADVDAVGNRLDVDLDAS